ERRKLFGIWQPIVEDLQRRTGLRLNLVTSLSVGEYERDVRQGNFDFVYMNPYLVLQVAATPGYVPLVRDQRPLRGILVVRKDSPYQKVEDLQGKTIAVPSWTALGASLLLRAELDRTFRVRMRAIDAKTHSSVFLHVLNDLADAGGAVQKTLAEQEPAVQGALRVLHSTQEVPSHPLAAHGRVPPVVRDKIRQAFIDMASSEDGRRLLAEIPMQRPVPATVEDYRPLQALALERYLQP
ncbi:MAG: phosphate/phosphite/phosphonate ABC transporter substrate-binding protein, partial [Rhodocyclaceae bacterium]|nr:phosphate/phosphite/phosphonate ABC transporter substrate-binding protein [Rhodocyclaceae bacterium]